jgi:ElaB/YqjD/DUF883 family membrane-anchored ribosome-binding protein
MQIIEDLLAEVRQMRKEVKEVKDGTIKMSQIKPSVSVDTSQIVEEVVSGVDRSLEGLKITLNETQTKTQTLANSIPDKIDSVKKVHLSATPWFWVGLASTVAIVVAILVFVPDEIEKHRQQEVEYLKHHLQYHIDNNPKTENSYQEQFDNPY